MIAYLVLGIAFVGMLGGGYMYVRNSGVESCRLEQAQKDAELAEMQRQWAASEQARLDVETKAQADEHAKYLQGKAEGLKLGAQARQRATEHVANDSGLTNASCVMSDSSLLYLNRIAAGVRSASYSAGTFDPVPTAGPTGGQALREPVPVGDRPDATRGAVGGVREEGRPADNGNQAGSGMVPAAKGHAPSPIKR